MLFSYVRSHLRQGDLIVETSQGLFASDELQKEKLLARGTGFSNVSVVKCLGASLKTR